MAAVYLPLNMKLSVSLFLQPVLTEIIDIFKERRSRADGGEITCSPYRDTTERELIFQGSVNSCFSLGNFA